MNKFAALPNPILISVLAIIASLALLSFSAIDGNTATGNDANAQVLRGLIHRGPEAPVVETRLAHASGPVDHYHTLIRASLANMLHETGLAVPPSQTETVMDAAEAIIDDPSFPIPPEHALSYALRATESGERQPLLSSLRQLTAGGSVLDMSLAVRLAQIVSIDEGAVPASAREAAADFLRSTPCAAHLEGEPETSLIAQAAVERTYRILGVGCSGQRDIGALVTYVHNPQTGEWDAEELLAAALLSSTPEAHAVGLREELSGLLRTASTDRELLSTLRFLSLTSVHNLVDAYRLAGVELPKHWEEPLAERVGGIDTHIIEDPFLLLDTVDAIELSDGSSIRDTIAAGTDLSTVTGVSRLALELASGQTSADTVHGVVNQPDLADLLWPAATLVWRAQVVGIEVCQSGIAAKLLAASSLKLTDDLIESALADHNALPNLAAVVRLAERCGVPSAPNELRSRLETALAKLGATNDGSMPSLENAVDEDDELVRRASLAQTFCMLHPDGSPPRGLAEGAMSIDPFSTDAIAAQSWLRVTAGNGCRGVAARLG